MGEFCGRNLLKNYSPQKVNIQTVSDKIFPGTIHGGDANQVPSIGDIIH